MSVDEHGFDRTRIDSVKVVELIQVERTSGHGKDETDSVRKFYDYYTADGEHVATCDTHPPGPPVSGSASWGNLEDSNGTWRQISADGRAWEMATHGDGSLVLVHERCTWSLRGESNLNLADARELVQLMEKVEGRH